MKKFQLKNGSVEIKWKDRFSIKEGIAYDNLVDEEIIKSFDTLEEAKRALKNYKTSIRELSNTRIYYSVEEYWIEEVEVDEDDEFIESLGVHAFSKIAIEVIEKEKYTTIGVFDNLKAAEEAAVDYDGETFLSY